MTVREPTDEQRQMARMMDLHPGMPEDWPMDLIDHLIEYRKNAPTERDFQIEFKKCVRYA